MKMIKKNATHNIINGKTKENEIPEDRSRLNSFYLLLTYLHSFNFPHPYRLSFKLLLDFFNDLMR